LIGSCRGCAAILGVCASDKSGTGPAPGAGSAAQGSRRGSRLVDHQLVELATARVERAQVETVMRDLDEQEVVRPRGRQAHGVRAASDEDRERPPPPEVR